MAPSHQAQRTLVKSRPELWAEVSDLRSLCRHLGDFGDIRITRLEPESTVAWEGTAARGTVELEASGWGTKVTLKAQALPPPDPEPVTVEPVTVVAPPTPKPVVPPQPPPGIPLRRGLLARLLGRRPAPAPPAAPPAQAPAQPAPAAPVQTVRARTAQPTAVLDDAATLAVLTRALDDLGAAHRRPFSPS